MSMAIYFLGKLAIDAMFSLKTYNTKKRAFGARFYV